MMDIGQPGKGRFSASLSDEVAQSSIFLRLRMSLVEFLTSESNDLHGHLSIATYPIAFSWPIAFSAVRPDVRPNF